MGKSGIYTSNRAAEKSISKTIESLKKNEIDESTELLPPTYPTH
jgi:predicted secreted acid phosphatase